MSFSFGAAGDFAMGSPFLANVVAVQAARVDFMLMLGDLGYTQGKESWWCQQWTDRNITELLIVAGNHDTGEECCGNFDNYLASCPHTIQEVGVPGIRYYIDYPLEKPLARIIMIAPNILGSVASYDTYGFGGEGYLWVERVLIEAKTKNIRWVIVGMHKNYISVLMKPDEIGVALMNLLFVHRVDLVLQAHEHGYERSKQLSCAVTNTFFSSCVGDSDNTLRKGNGTVIIVLGTGGMDLRGVDFVDSEVGYFRSFDTSTFGFGHFTISEEKIDFSFKRTSGGFFVDSFTIRDPSVPRPTPLTNAPSLPITQPPTKLPTRIPTPDPTKKSRAPSHRPTRTRMPTSFPSHAPSNQTYIVPTPGLSSAASIPPRSEVEISTSQILIYVLVPLAGLLLLLGIIAFFCWRRKRGKANNPLASEALEETKALQTLEETPLETSPSLNNAG